jgi:general secretion pathway protein G
MTGRNDTWTVEEETDTIMTVDQQEPGIFDVHSGATATGSDGTAYNTW